MREVEVKKRTDIYKTLGIYPTWSCSTFANSVLGARSSRSLDPFAFAATLVGKVPYYGLYKPENRIAAEMFKDYASLVHALAEALESLEGR